MKGHHPPGKDAGTATSSITGLDRGQPPRVVILRATSLLRNSCASAKYATYWRPGRDDSALSGRQEVA